MPTNANVFNSRVTSEALEAKFRQVFPAQGGAELVQDLFASGVIQPVVDFSSVAEGSVLPQNLQTAWDFSTGHQEINSSSSGTMINNTGFWKIDVVSSVTYSGSTQQVVSLGINDGLSTKPIWEINTQVSSGQASAATEGAFVIFLRAGDSFTFTSNNNNIRTDVFWRQIADVSGNLVNPLGFTFS
jgi:hypothetical protein